MVTSELIPWFGKNWFRASAKCYKIQSSSALFSCRFSAIVLLPIFGDQLPLLLRLHSVNYSIRNLVYSTCPFVLHFCSPCDALCITLDGKICSSPNYRYQMIICRNFLQNSIARSSTFSNVLSMLNFVTFYWWFHVSCNKIFEQKFLHACSCFYCKFCRTLSGLLCCTFLESFWGVFLEVNYRIFSVISDTYPWFCLFSCTAFPLRISHMQSVEHLVRQFVTHFIPLLE